MYGNNIVFENFKIVWKDLETHMFILIISIPRLHDASEHVASGRKLARLTV